ncbi:DotA/TraY family protein [Nitratidesulfovibrio vulgaris]|uniref:DotA/TraY family protein n=1 Tax=Nitratidesulfovibrio vulgaris TaxID=881 RepID=UPI00230109C6|nr:DotA/TraY family protein [Nitratidesulfovibrio vulgaris]WCB45677.1 DotA/TraY family protein [Nitratidesulfovibrio vulgaris]
MAAEIPTSTEVLLKSDASKQFLDNLIGQGWDSWGQGLGGSGAAELMLQLFSAFNLVALAVVSALFIWVLAIAVAGTAHEGTPFGKKFSSLWMPLRFVGAMGALAPIFKGLSFFQVAILACIGFSINLGNFVWDLGTDYFVEHGGQITVQAPDQNVTQYSAIANGALESLTMQYYLNGRRKLNVQPGGDWSYSSNWFSAGGEYKFLFNGNAGTITVECVDEGDALCRGKVNAVGTAVSALSNVASKLADPDTPASDIDPLALYNAANGVNSTILSGLQSYAQQGKLQTKLRDFQDISNQYGWFIAGSSYWSISWINQEVREAMYSGISYSPKEYSESELLGMTYGLRDFDAVRERVANYIKTAYTTRRGISDTTADPAVTDENYTLSSLGNWIRSKLNGLIAANILPTAVEKMSTQDPIMAISNVGDYLIGTAWGVATALAGIDVAQSLGKAIPIVGNAIPNMDKYISFALFSVFLPLLLYGLVLAYYLPAIPFIRWISALVGWVILIVESLIAAPLWLCAHALPEGDGAAGQHGKRGYLLLLGILIRPPLMVAGFFCAVILMNVLGRLIGAGFEMFIAGTSQTKIIGLTGTISMLVILGIVVIMMANKFFSLIHYLPEHVTNWIGQQFHSLGEKEDQAGVKGVFVGSTNAVSSGAQGAKELRGSLKAQDGRTTPATVAGPELSDQNFRS